ISYMKPTDASISENEDETPDHAVNGIPTEKWCGLVEENGAWMSIDLEKVETIDRWLVKHSGKIEGSGWNTEDFALEYQNENGEWIAADTVKGNRDDVTLRDIDPIKARYVRLFVTKPSQGEDYDPHARIYEFSVFKK
ncbi:MAG: discoidin domain-containing protein, partial [Clostridia bacterium]|nr:discoidin domain-containing protein [Clostridia bacterium]